MSVISALRLSHTPAMAFVTVGLFWGCFAAFVPVIKARLGATDAEFGLLLLGTAIGLVCTMFLAPIVDRWLGARTLQVCAVVLVFAFLLPGSANTKWMFFAAMMCAGFASGLLDVVMNARVSDLEVASGRSLMNANHGMFSVGYAAGAFGTGFARQAGFAPLAVFACVGVFVLALSTRMYIAPAAADQDRDANGRFPYSAVAICGVVVMIAFMTEAAVEAWSALHIERTLGGIASQGALGPTMLGLTMAVGRFSGQAVSDRLDDVTVIVGATLLCICGALGAAAAPTPLWAYLAFGTLGLGVSVIGPLGLALVGRLVPAQMRTAAIARTAVIGFIGFFMAPAAMGFVSHSYGLRLAFVALAGVVGLIFPTLWVLRRWGGDRVRNKV